MSFDLKQCSKGQPLAAGGEFRPLTFALFFVLGVLFAAFVLVFAPSAHAETQAEKVFGTWEKVTSPLDHVPEYRYGNDSMGSVTNQYRSKTPIREDRQASPAETPPSRPAAPEQVAGLNQPPERR